MGEAVTGGAFALLGIEPDIGRAIQPEDDVARGGHPVVMLSHGYWQRAFGGDPQVVGRTLRMGRRAYTIIGVAPADYRGGLGPVTPAFFVPMAMADELMGVDMLDQRDFHSFFVKARLAPGVTRAQAEHAASLVAKSLTTARPEGWVPGEQFTLVPTAEVQVLPGLDPLLRAAAWVLIAVVGLVLLLACTNLASFLLARALDRGQEVAVRRALGATRGALARQMLVESALLGLVGAACGLVLALVLVNVLLSIDLPLPYGMKLDLQLGVDWKTLVDWRVLAFTAGTGVLAGAFLGLIPAVQGTRADLGSALKTGTRGGHAPGALRWRNVLVAAQIAMSLVLLVGRGTLPSELATDARHRSGLRRCADVGAVRHGAGHDDRRQRASHATSARTLSSGPRSRRRRTRLATAARVLVQLHRLHDRRSRAAPGRGAFRADRAFSTADSSTRLA